VILPRTGWGSHRVLVAPGGHASLPSASVLACPYESSAPVLIPEDLDMQLRKAAQRNLVIESRVVRRACGSLLILWRAWHP